MSRYLPDPIWGTPAQGHGTAVSDVLSNSSRCGGRYCILREAKDSIVNLSDREKARLTSWLIEQRQLGNQCPRITIEVVKHIKRKSDVPESDRADAILKYIQSKTHELGKTIICSYSPWIEDIVYKSNVEEFNRIFLEEEHEIYYNLLAYSESIKLCELKFLSKYLSKRNWIEYEHKEMNRISFQLSIEGYIRIAEIQETKTVSSRGFMAMWFDQSMDKIWQEGFEPGIRKAGYDPVRIDQTQHVNKIDDEIIAEIRRSRFLVADFTQGETGARGGVYYEAGFAHGLDIPVIFTCRKDCLGKIHFDVRQYNCITWEKDDLRKLQEDLTNRITAILGDGPGRSAS